MVLDDDQLKRPTRRASVTEVMQVTCGPIYKEIKRVFNLEILHLEIRKFAKEQGIEEKINILAEHIAYIFVHIYRRQDANIVGLKIQARIDLSRMVQLDEKKDFDDSLLVEPIIDPEMHQLALAFLSR